MKKRENASICFVRGVSLHVYTSRNRCMSVFVPGTRILTVAFPFEPQPNDTCNNIFKAPDVCTNNCEKVHSFNSILVVRFSLVWAVNGYVLYHQAFENIL